MTSLTPQRLISLILALACLLNAILLGAAFLDILALHIDEGVGMTYDEEFEATPIPQMHSLVGVGLGTVTFFVLSTLFAARFSQDRAHKSESSQTDE